MINWVFPFLQIHLKTVLKEDKFIFYSQGILVLNTVNDTIWIIREEKKKVLYL